MTRFVLLFILLTLLNLPVLADTFKPIVSDTQSATCPLDAGYISYSSTPRLTNTSCELIWGNGSSYLAIVRYRPIGGQWVYKPNQRNSGPGYGYTTLTELTPATTYEWQIASQCSPTDTSVYAAPKSFTTLPCTNSSLYLTTNYISTNKVTLNWFGQASFVLEWRQVGASSWTTINPVPARPFSLTGLTDQTAYEWRVADQCTPTQHSDYSPVQSFTTGCPMPINPTTSNIGYTSAQLNWYGLPEAMFEVQVQPQGSTSWSTVSTQTATSYALNAPNAAYTWRVRTACESNRYSEFTAPQSFTMAPCPSPSLYRAGDFSLNAYSASFQVYLGYGSVYSIQWREANTTTWQTIDNNSEQYFTLTSLHNKTAYEIRAQTQCSTTDRSAFTEPISFTAACQIPRLDNYGLTYGYVTVYGLIKASALIQWRDAGAEDWNTSPLLNELNENNSVYYWFMGKPNQAYEFRAQAVCADGSFSDFTPIRSERVYPSDAPPVQSLVVPCVGWESARVRWQANQALHDNIILQWRQKKSLCWNTISVGDSIQSPTYGSSSGPYREYLLRGLQPNIEYECRIGGTLSDDVDLVFTEPISFKTTDGTVNVTSYTNCPATGANQVIVYLYAQNCYSSANQYECQYRVVGSVDWQSVRFTQATQYRLTGLMPNLTYEYRVRLSVPNVYVGNFSPVATVTTGYGKIDNLYSLGVNGRECTGSLIGWNDCLTVGAKYEIFYKRVDIQGGASLSVTTESNYQYKLEGLDPEAEYAVQVRAVYPDGTVTPFVSGTVITGCGTIFNSLPYYLRHYNITAQTAQLRWSGYGPYELRWRKGYTTTWNTTIIDYRYSGFQTDYTLINLEADTPYEWQVRSVRSEPNYFSPIQFFRTVCNAPVYNRAKTTSATSASLMWTQSAVGQLVTLQWRKKGESAWQRVENISRPDYTLINLQRNTVYEWRVSTQCTASSAFAEGPTQTFKTLQYVDLLYTVQPGNWTDPAVWSCNRLPTANDGVHIFHRVSVPANQMGHAATVSYGDNGTITFEQQARLKLSF